MSPDAGSRTAAKRGTAPSPGRIASRTLHPESNRRVPCRDHYARAAAHPDRTVTLAWADGASATVSLARLVDRGGAFGPLRDPAYLVREMRVMPQGIGVAWPNEADFSAGGLRRDAFPDEPDDATLPARTANAA